MNVKKLMAALTVAATVMACGATATHAADEKKTEEKAASTCPLTGVCNAITGTIGGIFAAIGGVFGGGK